MIRATVAVLVCTLAAPAAIAAEKEEACGYQSDVVRAIQKARLDRVKERNVQQHILAAKPDWPENYNTTIPLITPWVYEQTRKVLRKEDLGAAWQEMCLSNWDQIQAATGKN